MAGRQAIADRIEGLAEGWQYVPTSEAAGFFKPTATLTTGATSSTSIPAYNTGNKRLWGSTASNFT
jgi:hypothetical protein